MKTYKREWILLVLVLILSFGALMIKVISSSALNETQINKLRLQYPLYQKNPDLISISEPRLDEIIKRPNTSFVLAEVVEVLPEYNTVLTGNSNNPEDKIYDKGKEYGLTNSATFIQYRIRVTEEIVGNFFDKNDTEKNIIIFVNSQFKGYTPELKPGMRIVTPITKGTDLHDGKYGFSKYGFYYVTNNGYVLSAYTEDKDIELTGKPLNDLIAMIKEISK